MVKHANYWFSTHQTKLEVTAGLPRKVDVAIIGGGVSGFSLLFDLVTNTSLSVVLLEADSPAFHASGRDTGHIAEVGPLSLFHLRRHVGDETISLYEHTVRVNNDWIRAIIQREHIDCGYHKCGGIYLGNGKEGFKLDEFVSFCPESRRQFLGKESLQAIVPTEIFNSGVYVPGEATLNPYKFVYGLHHACDEVGRHVIANGTVQRVTPITDGLRLYVKNRGTFVASSVVYCTGAYTIDLLRGLKGKVALWKTHVVGSSKLSREQLRQFPEQPMSHMDKSIRISDDRILISGGINPVANPACDGVVEQSSFQRLESWCRSVFQSIPKTISANSVWSYVNCTGKDGLPLIGPIPGRPNEYISVGSDLNFAFAAAFMIRNYLTEGGPEDDRWRAFHPERILE